MPKRTLNDFYSNFLTHSVPKKELKQSQVYNMFDKPKADKGEAMPHYIAPKGAIYQADVLYMPTDPNTGQKYILVVVDVGSKITDAEGMKERDAKTVLETFKKIFKRKILKAPEYLLQTDAGTEFDATTIKTYFKSLGVSLRFGKTGRSRMQALAEARNKLIGKALFMRMTANELETGEEDKEWSQFLSPLVKEYNEFIKSKKVQEMKDEPNINSKTILLEVGQKVRVMLDKPKTVLGNKLYGTFRASDVRWDPKISIISNVILTPSQPPLYQVDNKSNPAYTYNQLQIVDDEQEKKTNIPQGKYLIDKIVDERKKGKVIEFKVRWKGYTEKDDTWMARTALLNNAHFKNLVDQFKKAL